MGGGTVRMIQEIGWGNAMRYLLTADEIPAAEALRLGLVQEVAEPGKQLERALAIATTVAAQAPLGVQATLKSARIARIQGDKAALARLLPDLMPIMQSEGCQGRRTGIYRKAYSSVQGALTARLPFAGYSLDSRRIPYVRTDPVAQTAL